MLAIKDGRIDLNRMGVRGPSSTRTYMVHDGTEQIGLHPIAAGMVNAPLYLFYLIIEKYKKNKSRS